MPLQYSSFTPDHARDFADNLDAFFAGVGRPPRPIIRDIGATATVDKADHDCLDPFAELEALVATNCPPLPLFSVAELEEARADCERINDPLPMSAYDREFVALRTAEAERDDAEPDSAAYLAAMSKVAEAKRRFKIEAERGLDDGFRQLRDIDDWRRRGGRESYNAGRRKVRAISNARPSAMTAADRIEHERTQANDHKYASRKRAEGWTSEQITAGLARRHAKKIAALTNS